MYALPFQIQYKFSALFFVGICYMLHGNSWPSNEMSEISFRGNIYWMINRSQYIICILPIRFYNYMSLQIYIWIISLQWDKWFLPFMESSMIFYFISNNNFNNFHEYRIQHFKIKRYQRQVKVSGTAIIYKILTFVTTSELSICNKIILRFI